MVSGKFLTCPVLVINFAGEMLYILNQRLDVQSLSEQKCLNVLNDICSCLFFKQFIDELFLNNKTLSSQHLKSLFLKSTNSSMMKLSPNSFSKLYDLMIMGVKLQVFLSSSPLQLYSITLNHLEGISNLLGNGSAKPLVQYAISKFKSKYAQLPFPRYLQIKMQILNKLKYDNLRILTFLQNYYQDREKGFFYLYRRYSPHLNTPVGTVIYSDYKQQLSLGARDLKLNQFLKENFTNWKSELGQNMYLGVMPMKSFNPGTFYTQANNTQQKFGEKTPADNSLTEMIRGSKSNKDIQFTLDLFQNSTNIPLIKKTEKEEENKVKHSTKIDNKNMKQDVLKEIEADEKVEEEDDDLLNMMDEAMKI